MVCYPKNINSLSITLNIFIHLHHHTFSKFPCKLPKGYCELCQNSEKEGLALRHDSGQGSRPCGTVCGTQFPPLRPRCYSPVLEKAGATEERITKSPEASISSEPPVPSKSRSKSWVTAGTRRS